MIHINIMKIKQMTLATICKTKNLSLENFFRAKKYFSGFSSTLGKIFNRISSVFGRFTLLLTNGFHFLILKSGIEQ